MDQANILIIGGGVIGCAIARAVSERWQDVFLVEQFPKLGMATSTRNSGVNHSGIYYPKGSLKARLCVEGNRLTYEFCEKHKVPFRHCGKLVVAADGHEQPELLALKKRGEDNGVEGLELVDQAEIRKREPHIRGVAALHVPSSGIVSAEELVHAYARVATNQGANMVTHAKVVSLEPSGGAIRVGLKIGDEEDAQEEKIDARCAMSGTTPLPYVVESAMQLGHAWLLPNVVPARHHPVIVDSVISPDPNVPPAIHLVGMESPGLTAAAAVANYIAQMLKDVLA